MGTVVLCRKLSDEKGISPIIDLLVISSFMRPEASWFSRSVRVDNSDNNVLETYGSYDGWRTVVRRGCPP